MKTTTVQHTECNAGAQNQHPQREQRNGQFCVGERRDRGGCGQHAQKLVPKEDRVQRRRTEKTEAPQG